MLRKTFSLILCCPLTVIACPIEDFGAPGALRAAFACEQYAQVVEQADEWSVDYNQFEFRMAALLRLYQFEQARASIEQMQIQPGVGQNSQSDWLLAVARAEELAGEDYWFDRVLLDPTDGEANLKLYEAQLRANNYPGVLATLTRIEMNAGASLGLTRAKIDAHLQMGNLAQALVAIDQILTLDTLDPEDVSDVQGLRDQILSARSSHKFSGSLGLGVRSTDNPQGASDLPVFVNGVETTSDRTNGEIAYTTRGNAKWLYADPTRQIPLFSMAAAISDTDYINYNAGDNRRLSLQSELQSWDRRFSGQVSHAIQWDDDGRQETTGRLSLSYSQSEPGQQWRVSGGAEWIDDLQQPGRSGVANDLNGLWFRGLGDYGLTVFGGIDDFDANDVTYSFEQATFGGSLGRTFERFRVNARWQLSHRRYLADDSFASIISLSDTAIRKDRRQVASVTLSVPSRQSGWPDFDLRASQDRTNSTINLYTKTSRSAEASLTWRFK